MGEERRHLPAGGQRVEGWGRRHGRAPLLKATELHEGETLGSEDQQE